MKSKKAKILITTGFICMFLALIVMSTWGADDNYGEQLLLFFVLDVIALVLLLSGVKVESEYKRQQAAIAQKEQEEKARLAEQEHEKILTKMRSGTWEFPSKLLCRKCFDNNIVDLSSSYNMQKAKAIAQQLLIQNSVPNDAHALYLTDERLVQYFAAGSDSARKRQENAEKARLKKLRQEEIEEEKQLTIYACYQGREKRIAMIHADLDPIRGKAAEMKAVATGCARQSATYKEAEGNWALAGGVASGLAGPGAGVVAALATQQENEAARARSAAVRAGFKNDAATLLLGSFEYERKEKELLEELEKAELAAVSDMTPTDVFRYLNIRERDLEITETGAFRIRAYVSLKEQLTEFGEIEAVVDGVVSAVMYQGGEKVGTAKLVLPKEGACYAEEITVTGIALGTAVKGQDYTVQFTPGNLWIMEA